MEPLEKRIAEIIRSERDPDKAAELVIAEIRKPAISPWWNSRERWEAELKK